MRYTGGSYGGDRGNPVNVGPRTDRWNTGGRAANTPVNTRTGDIPVGTGTTGGRRAFTDDIPTPAPVGGGISASPAQGETVRNPRLGNGSDQPNLNGDPNGGKRGGNRPTTIENYQFGETMQPVKNAAATAPDNFGGGRRGQLSDEQPGRYNQPAMQPEIQPQYTDKTQSGGRRGGFFGQNNGDTRAAENPAPSYDRPQRTYEQPQRTYDRPQRTYEQPQRVYEQPQRTYEQPQRSYEQPQRSGGYGGGGGGNSGGGGGGGRRGGGGMN